MCFLCMTLLFNCKKFIKYLSSKHKSVEQDVSSAGSTSLKETTDMYQTLSIHCSMCPCINMQWSLKLLNVIHCVIYVVNQSLFLLCS